MLSKVIDLADETRQSRQFHETTALLMFGCFLQEWTG
jgi:hypothetical protein